MKASRFSDAQKAFILKQAEEGVPIVAAISSDACVAAQEAPGTIVPISLPARPALYA